MFYVLTCHFFHYVGMPFMFFYITLHVNSYKIQPLTYTYEKIIHHFQKCSIVVGTDALHVALHFVPWRLKPAQ